MSFKQQKTWAQIAALPSGPSSPERIPAFAPTLALSSLPSRGKPLSSDKRQSSGESTSSDRPSSSKRPSSSDRLASSNGPLVGDKPAPDIGRSSVDALLSNSKPQPSPLLRLPRELRDLIFEHILPNRPLIEAGSYIRRGTSPTFPDQYDEHERRLTYARLLRKGNNSWRATEMARCNISTLRLNKQLYDEGMDTMCSRKFEIIVSLTGTVFLNWQFAWVDRASHSSSSSPSAYNPLGNFPFDRVRKLRITIWAARLDIFLFHIHREINGLCKFLA